MNVHKGRMPTKIELTLEQSQQGVSNDVLDHRIHKDGDGDASFQLKSDSLPHAHAQSTKTFYKHQDSRIMKAQELKTKTSAQTLILKITPQKSSFGGDYNDKGSRSKITKHEGTSLQRRQRQRSQELNDKNNLIDLMKECHNELTSGEIVSLKIMSRTMEVRSLLIEFDHKTSLFETMTKSKSFNNSPKQRALYHALMESILKDEDVMDKGVADKLKKMKRDDVDKDEDPSARSDRVLNRQKTSKDIEPSKKAKSTETSKGTSKS
ncbi:hypothetical protein Tco_1346834 [Tanacetum coccineum]